MTTTPAAPPRATDASSVFARAGRALVDAGRAVARVVGPPATRLRDVLASSDSVVTPAGWSVLVLAATSLAAGYLLGWTELTFLGLTAVAALAACTLFLLGRTSYEVGFVLSPPRVTIGEPAEILVSVQNVGERTVSASRMELRVGADVRELAVPRLIRQAKRTEPVPLPTEQRAVIPVGPAVTVRGDALGLLRRTLRWGGPVEMFVHPRTIPLEPSAAGLVRDLEGQVTKRITTSDLSFHTLRPYVPGDDSRHIHWRSTARLFAVTKQHMVRLFEETRRSQLTIVQSENREYYASADEFELAVSITASIAQQVIRDGTATSVVCESRMLRTHTATALLDDTCRLELGTTTFPDIRAFVRHATRRLPPPSVLVLVGGSKMTPLDARAVQLLFPGESTMIAITAEPGAKPSLRDMSGILVAHVGRLEELRRVFRYASGS